MFQGEAGQTGLLERGTVGRDELTLEHHDHQVIIEELYDDQLLTECYGHLSDGKTDDGMKKLMLGLNDRRADSSEPEWKDYVRMCLLHPIRRLIHQDPFTLRAFVKPRGYAGDAELLDYIYGVDEGRGPPHGTSLLGEQIFHFNTRTTPACKGVRDRACLVAEMIDRASLEKTRPQILSVAAGHLREANLSGALKQKRLGRWVAFDADVTSLAEVKRCYGPFGVEAVGGTVREMLLGRMNLGEFDFIYSTGLFDYLQQSVGKRLTTRCFRMLKPGGQLLIANFLTGIEGRGYMESFMDWNLTYRNHSEMLDLAMGIDQKTVKDIHLTADKEYNILFLHLTKK